MCHMMNQNDTSSSSPSPYVLIPKRRDLWDLENTTDYIKAELFIEAHDT